MTEETPERHDSLVGTGDQPLIGIVLSEGEPEIVGYVTTEHQLAGLLNEGDIQAALDLAGNWGDLEWTDVESALDRIRHQSRPSPPLAL